MARKLADDIRSERHFVQGRSLIGRLRELASARCTLTEAACVLSREFSESRDRLLERMRTGDLRDAFADAAAEGAALARVQLRELAMAPELSRHALARLSALTRFLDEVDASLGDSELSRLREQVRDMTPQERELAFEDEADE